MISLFNRRFNGSLFLTERYVHGRLFLAGSTFSIAITISYQEREVSHDGIFDEYGGVSQLGHECADYERNWGDSIDRRAGMEFYHARPDGVADALR